MEFCQAGMEDWIGRMASGKFTRDESGGVQKRVDMGMMVLVDGSSTEKENGVVVTRESWVVMMGGIGIDSGNGNGSRCDGCGTGSGTGGPWRWMWIWMMVDEKLVCSFYEEGKARKRRQRRAGIRQARYARYARQGGREGGTRKEEGAKEAARAQAEARARWKKRGRV